MAWNRLEPADTASARAALHEALADRERNALYPAVLRAPHAGDPATLYRHARAQSRLVTVALRHGRLTPEQYEAIGAFRLRQYVLCGLYDALTVADDPDEMDPSIEALAPEAIHVCCGTPDGRLLGYMCMETARHRTSVAMPISWPGRYVFGTSPRPLFATEFELYGPGVFSSLPYLRDTDVAEARELSRMLRNQVVASPLSVAAMIEIVLAMHHLVTDPALAIKVTLGCLGREGRILMAQLGVPLLFAPDAPVRPQQVALARATRGGAYWSANANAPGQFWPFVIASEDVRRHAAHFAQLDALLNLGVADLRRSLVHFRRERRMIEPETLLADLAGSAIRWTADPAGAMTPACVPWRGE